MTAFPRNLLVLGFHNMSCVRTGVSISTPGKTAVHAIFHRQQFILLRLLVCLCDRDRCFACYLYNVLNT